jgi:hypothetical protein
MELMVLLSQLILIQILGFTSGVKELTASGSQGFNPDRGSAHPVTEHAAFSFTPDLTGMSYEQRAAYLDSIAQGPGGR